ncbi:Homeobox-leucine zipper family protein / lipid-binding START domain-containing protein [Trifolium repens]|nr:Homeobox-leucine zipper family protein / lipid-binding START domain-containing protein [Trifolium repens]
MDDNIGSILGIIDEEEADDLVMLDGPPVANENDSAKEDGVKKKKAGTSKAWKYKVLVKKLNLYVKLEGHQGCVNAVEFNSTGDVIVSAEQVQASERVYAQCPKPSSLHRQQLIRECPIFANIEPKQIKVWFQNRRCREKRRKEACTLQSVNRKLSAKNKLEHAVLSLSGARAASNPGAASQFVRAEMLSSGLK